MQDIHLQSVRILPASISTYFLADMNIKISIQIPMHQHLDPNPNFTVPNCVRSKIVSIGVYKTFTQSIP